MIYMLISDGFEEIEAIGTIDILCRCGLDLQVLSVTGRRVVTGAHGIVLKVDSLFRKNHLVNVDAIILPGGLKNAQTLASNTMLRQAIASLHQQGIVIAAICAAPIVLDASGILKGQHFTCYPSLASRLKDGIYHNSHYCVCCGNLITASGPAATRSFAFTIANLFAKEAMVEQVAKDMLFPVGQQQQDTICFDENVTDVAELR